ncbi:MAG TPA: type II toxin-antitoxin system VapC family toxin [Mesorhizobium sp.]|jgi:ribonuclease VapC|nr:type II toxin-antitoxin system VapC family toxin [Mesorhizobium sp.]
MIAVDSSAIISILRGEEDAGLMAECLSSADAKVMSLANYMECGTVAVRKLGGEPIRILKGLIAAADIDLVPLKRHEAEIGIEAYRRFGRGSGHRASLNYGDCFAYALATARNVPLLFKGDDFIHTDVVPALTRGRGRP